MANNKILIVDDEVDLAFIMSEMLSEYGYEKKEKIVCFGKVKVNITSRTVY